MHAREKLLMSLSVARRCPSARGASLRPHGRQGGRIFFKAAPLPPTRKFSSPAAACILIRSPGRRQTPRRAAAACASSRTQPTVSVLQSASTAPGRAPAIAPSAPNHIAREAASSATMQKTRSAPAAARAPWRRPAHRRATGLRPWPGCGEDHHGKAGAEEPARHAAAHDAEAEESDARGEFIARKRAPRPGAAPQRKRRREKSGGGASESAAEAAAYFLSAFLNCLWPAFCASPSWAQSFGLGVVARLEGASVFSTSPMNFFMSAW